MCRVRQVDRLRRVSEPYRKVNTSPVSLSIGSPDWLLVWIFGKHTPRQQSSLTHTFVFPFFFTPRSSLLIRPLFANIHKQINLTSTCWRWAWSVRGILSVMNGLGGKEGRAVWEGCMSRVRRAVQWCLFSCGGAFQQRCSLPVDSGGNRCWGKTKTTLWSCTCPFLPKLLLEPSQQSCSHETWGQF